MLNRILIFNNQQYKLIILSNLALKMSRNNSLESILKVICFYEVEKEPWLVQEKSISMETMKLLTKNWLHRLSEFKRVTTLPLAKNIFDRFLSLEKIPDVINDVVLILGACILIADSHLSENPLSIDEIGEQIHARREELQRWTEIIKRKLNFDTFAVTGIDLGVALLSSFETEPDITKQFKCDFTSVYVKICIEPQFSCICSKLLTQGALLICCKKFVWFLESGKEFEFQRFIVKKCNKNIDIRTVKNHKLLEVFDKLCNFFSLNPIQTLSDDAFPNTFLIF